MIDRDTFWSDLTSQLKSWVEGGKTGNQGTRFGTGYGGPYKPNESIANGEFKPLQSEWRAHCKGLSLDCNISASLSGRDEEVWDFIATPFGAPKQAFCYHIKVPGSLKKT